MQLRSSPDFRGKPINSQVHVLTTDGEILGQVQLLFRYTSADYMLVEKYCDVDQEEQSESVQRLGCQYLEKTSQSPYHVVLLDEEVRGIDLVHLIPDWHSSGKQRYFLNRFLWRKLNIEH